MGAKTLQGKYAERLEIENKQLKEQINEYQKAVDETTSEKIDLQQVNKQLKEENKQLKIENAYYKSKILGGNSQLQELNSKIEILGDKE